MNAYYAAQVDEKEAKEERERSAHQPRPAATTSSSSISRPSSATPTSFPKSGTTSASKPKFKSFSELIRGNQDDDDDDEQRNTFAGGETSGLEVTDPNNSNSLIRDLLEKAQRGGQRPSDTDEDTEEQNKHHFVGKGYRLGSSVDEAPRVVEDIQEDLPSKPKKVTRQITFWKQGFQVGEGGLFRYDDPANSYYLNELNQGRAPLKLLDVEFGQEVDVNVYRKLDESFKPPKKAVKGFQGAGKRLGSPIPGESLSPEPIIEESKPAKDEDEEEKVEPKGDTNVQIRYASGKREVLRCESTDTIRHLYEHVKNNTQDSRTFTLNHAFPVKPIENFDATVKEEGLCNAVVVQRWV